MSEPFSKAPHIRNRNRIPKETEKIIIATRDQYPYCGKEKKQREGTEPALTHGENEWPGLCETRSSPLLKKTRKKRTGIVLRSRSETSLKILINKGILAIVAPLMFINLDESGSFYGDKDSFFIVGGFVTGDQKRTSKVFKKWRQGKFPKRISHKSEVKFSDTDLTEMLKIQTLRFLAQQDIRIFYTFLNIRNIPAQYRRKKHIDGGLLYTELVAQTLNLLIPSVDAEFRIFRDHRHLKGISQTQFNEIVTLSLLTSLPAKSLIQIEAVDSTASLNIQIADWICGALSRYYHKKQYGDDYFKAIKNNIIASKEIFEDFWGKFSDN